MTLPADTRRSLPRPPAGLLGDLVLFLAVVPVVMGGVAMLHLGLGVSFEAASLAGLAYLAALVGLYVVSRRHGAVRALNAELDELKAEVELLRLGHFQRLGAAPARRQMATEAQPAGGGATTAATSRLQPAPVAPETSSAAASRSERQKAAELALRRARERQPPTGAVPQAGSSVAATASTAAVTQSAPTGTASAPAPLPPAHTAPAQSPAPAMSQAASSWPKVAPAAGARGTQLDLATMQALIEQLATKLNQPLDESDAAAAAPRAAAREVVTSASPEAIAAALQTLVAAGARTSAATAPVGHIALVAEAVEANRIDVYLDPILGLADRKTRHFELSVRLRTETDHELTAGDYVGVAQGTGLLARIDQAKLSRAAEIARRLRLRGNSAALFSSLTGEALADDGFLAAFAALFEAEEGLGTRLVITFSQADARTFTMAHWEAIHDMAGIGLKFALEDVTDLDMDFSVLKQYGFEFIKLDASVFLEGLPAQGGRIPAADICRHLSGMGLGLIVGGIVAERELARILGFGVLLGQGALFGGPRSVALERERQQAA